MLLCDQWCLFGHMHQDSMCSQNNYTTFLLHRPCQTFAWQFFGARKLLKKVEHLNSHWALGTVPTHANLKERLNEGHYKPT